MELHAKYGYLVTRAVDGEGNDVCLVLINRAKDIQYAEGITLETHLLDTQAQIAALQASIANIVSAIADMQTYLTEQFGYVPGDHEASEAWVPLFDVEPKVPTES